MRDIRGWSVLLLAPELLWEADCLFSPENAACSSARRHLAGQQNVVDAFEALFAGQHRAGGLPAALPTNPQSEVLVRRGRIPADRILFAAVQTDRVWESLPAALRSRTRVDAGLFAPRCDFENWRAMPCPFPLAPPAVVSPAPTDSFDDSIEF